MSRNHLWVLAVATAGLAFPGGARAAYCGASDYPAGCAAPENCCAPAVRYKVCYKTVVDYETRVCQRPVYRTVMRECRYTTCRPVYEQQWRECRTTTCRPVVESYPVVRHY